jgi:hypothetical protein
MEKFNSDYLQKVKVNDFYPARWWKHTKEKIFLGIKIQDEGFRMIYGDGNVRAEPPKGYTFKEGKLYENPEVVMTFRDRVETRKIFNTLQEAKEFAEAITMGKKWLLIHE